MVKKKSKRQITLFGKTFRLWQLGLVVIILFFISLFAYNLYLDAQDRKKFDEIEYTVNILTSRLENEFGIEGEYDNYCYESSEKFTTGPTICVYQKKYTNLNKRFSTYNDFVLAQSDIVSWSKKFHNEYYDFEILDNKYSCSTRWNGTELEKVLTIECSTLARKSYYPFSD